ncbi:MFS transporter [Streptomyces sp. NPDC017673]|uniref:MFS transporter n=1 Tax=unclassified Streptomyces TaxID=2593676 RepID=UPI0037BA3C81
MTASAPAAGAAHREALGSVFWTFWFGRGLSTLGGYLQFLALPLWVQRTTGSALAAVVSFAVFHLPKLLISPFAGLIADRFDRRRVVIVTDLAAAAVVAGMIGAVRHREVTLLLLLLFVLQALAVARVPALSSLLPDAIPRSRLLTANSLLDATTGLAMTLGPLIGTAALTAFGIEWVLLLNGLTFVVAAICMTPLPAARHEPLPHTGLAALLGGVRAVREDTVLRDALIAEAAVYLFFGAVTEQLAVHLGQHHPGSLVGVFGVGTGLGWIAVTALTARARDTLSPARLLWWSSLACAPVGLAAVWLVGHALWPAVALAGIVISVHQFAYGIGPVLLCQLRAPNAVRGRVMAFRRMLTTSAQLVALTAGALLASRTPVTVAVCGVLAAVAAAPFAHRAARPASPGSHRPADPAVDPATAPSGQ